MDRPGFTFTMSKDTIAALERVDASLEAVRAKLPPTPCGETMERIRGLGETMKAMFNQHVRATCAMVVPPPEPPPKFKRRFMGNAHQRRVQRRAFMGVRERLLFPSEP